MPAPIMIKLLNCMFTLHLLWSAMDFRSLVMGLIIGFVCILGLLVTRTDWIGVIATIIIFAIIKGRLKFEARSFWYGEIIALLGIDALAFINAMMIPFFAEHIVYAIGTFIPSLLLSVIALAYFGRKKTRP